MVGQRQRLICGGHWNLAKGFEFYLEVMKAMEEYKLWVKIKNKLEKIEGKIQAENI